MRNLAPFLQGHWKGIKDENGLVHDFSGNANHGTITGATNPEGRDGICMHFDAADDRVLISDNAAIQNIFDSGGSITVWIKPDSDGENSEGRIIDKSSIALYLQNEASGKTEIRFDQNFSDTNGGWSTTATELSISSWNHIVVVYDNSAVTNDPVIYVNGIQVALTEDSTPVGTRTTDVGSDLYIGDNVASDRCFDGDIESLGFYDTELAADEAEVLAGRSSRSLVTVPVGKMRRYFDFNGSSDFIDVGAGYNGVKSIEFWAKPQTTTEYFVDLDGTDYIDSSGGTIGTGGITSPTIYVDGTESSTIVANEWQHIIVTTGTGINASDLDIGRIDGVGYLEGMIAKVRLYSDELTVAEVIEHYNSVFADESALVGHWKMDETQSFLVRDYSTQGDDGTQTDPTKQPAVIHDLDIPYRNDSIFYEPLSDEMLTKRWVVVSGSFEPIHISSWGTHSFSDDNVPATGMKNVTAGVIGIPVPEQLQDLSTQRIEWTWKMLKGGAASPLRFLLVSSEIALFDDAAQDAYILEVNDNKRVRFCERNGGVLGTQAYTADAYVNQDQWYECRVTRDASGEFTFYVDDAIVDVSGGAGSNPVTDVTITVCTYIVLNFDIGDCVSSIKVRRY